MSLVVWLPLTQDLRNNGLSNVTITNNGATIDNNGKLGKCYNLNGSSNKITISNLPNPANISVAFWMKRNATTNTRQFMFTAWGGVTCEMTEGNRIHCYTNGGGGACDSTTTVTADTGWVHVVYTFQDKVGGKLYLNGSLITSTASSASINWTTTTGNIGNYSNLYYNGKMNDFRIYDHILSAKEVKELSKGLVLHYQLNKAFSIDNLVRNDTYVVYNNFSGECPASLTATGEVYNGCNVYRLSYTPSSNTLSSVQTQLFSHGIYGFRKTFLANTKYCFWILYKPISHPDTIAGGTASNIGGWTEIAPKDWGGGWKIVGQYRNGDVTTDKTDNIFVSFKTPSATANTPITIDFCCPHLVQGVDHILPEYDYIGTNPSISIDSSGYNYHGTINGTLSCTTDTPRYSVSTNLKNTSTYIKISNLTTTGFANSYSFAWWGNVNSYSGLMMWGFSNGIRLNGIYNGNLWNTGDGSNNPLYSPGTTTQVSPPTTNVWHHFVMTGDGTTCKVYKDGELWATAKTYKAISGTEIIINGWDTGTTYKYNNYYMSDFRIYATALSADDVKELYNTIASVSNNGSFLTYGEFIEI